MTALVTARATREREGKDFGYEVAAGVVIFAGAMVALDAYGYARPAGGGTSSRALGVALSTVDNTNGAAGSQTVVVRRSCFAFATTDVTVADVGKDCYAVDDQTVTTTQTNCKAGVIVGVELEGKSLAVWVDMAMGGNDTSSASPSLP